MSAPQETTSGVPAKGEPIPQPPQHLFGLLGNFPDVDPSFPLASFWKLSDIYGPIVKLNLRQEIIIFSSQKLVNEVCDEERSRSIPRQLSKSCRPSRHPGDRISCFIRTTNIGFRLPPNPETPVIMIAAGTGIAPMHAFIQERAAIAEAGVRKLGPATLFVGCRHEDKDFIYKDELLDCEKQRVVKVKPAFSKMENKPKYVQDVTWENREEVADMFKAGGKIYLCGSAARLGKSAAEVCKKIYVERTGATEHEADQWLERQKEDRYVSDVFG